MTITGLEAGTQYEVRAYLMSTQGFDLYSGGNPAEAGVLIAEETPASKWIANLAGGGVGKSQIIPLSTPLAPPPPPPPPPPPTPPLPTPRPETDDDDDDAGHAHAGHSGGRHGRGRHGRKQLTAEA